MRILNTLFILLFIINVGFAQVDKNGNPVFNNIELGRDIIGDFELTSSYYTIDNNISNKESSVYVSDHPTSKEYFEFARNMPSYFFIIGKGSEVFAMVILIQKNEGTKTTLFYNVLNLNNGERIEIPCRVWGDISEKRANELLELEVDGDAKIVDFPNNGKAILFEGIAYRIQPFDKLKEEVVLLAKNY